jgi:hypothetical protein
MPSSLQLPLNLLKVPLTAPRTSTHFARISSESSIDIHEVNGIEYSSFILQATATLVVASDLPDDGGDGGEDHQSDDLIEDETPRDEPEQEDVEPLHGRWPDQNEPMRYESNGKMLDRFCTCAWEAFKASTSLEVECSRCLYWYHTKCTSLYRASAKHVENVEFICDVCGPLNR